MSTSADDLAEETLFDSLGISSNLNNRYLNAGAPGPKSLQACADLLVEATKIRLAPGKDPYIVQYGPVFGEHAYLDQLASFLTRQYGSVVDRNSLVCTSGATSGLQMVMNILYTGSQPTIFLEQLSYHLAFEVLKSYTGDKPFVSVPLTANGIDIDVFEKSIIEHLPHDYSQRTTPWAIFYAVPTFHNPTGIYYDEDTSTKLITLLRRYNILMVCDDVYNTLYYRENGSPKRMFAYDNKSDPDYKGNVISNGSFSKILTPGLRLGWMEVPDWFRQLFGKHGVLHSGGSLNQYTSGIIATALEEGFVDKFIDDHRKLYKERLVAVKEALNSLPPGCKYQIPEGGYFVWIELPTHLKSKPILESARDNYGIFAYPGERFSCNPAKTFKNCLRIAISYYEKEQLKESITKLCEIICEYEKRL